MPSPTIAQIDNQPDGLVRERFPAIIACLELFGDDESFSSIRDQIESAINLDDRNLLIPLYHQIIPHLESRLWADNQTQQDYLDRYQALFRELEDLIALQSIDNRHRVTVVIPVADRPGQLSDCIDSLLIQCKRYNYGGQANNQFNKLSVIIADDSVNAECIKQTKLLCEKSNNNGLSATYLGRDEQEELISQLSEKQKNDLVSHLGDMHIDRSKHKGPSAMRNLCYLYLSTNKQKQKNDIFYFIDSDQLFSINPEESNTQNINYFYYLDRIFTEHNAQLVTGKVVGDPPVSPAVMANTLLADVISLLQQILCSPSANPCQFHQHSPVDTEDATYHDMADLFGFTPENKSYEYDCPLSGEHTNHDCLVDFSHRLNQFFHGEHPTRSTHYQYLNPLDSIVPARTVYTGNYAFKSDALAYFIPFSNLRLRMAGPTLGRILKSVMGNRFISTNLPMLHKRTLGDTGKAECRPGVDITDNLVDLSQEYIRQYFGDVMLFSIEKLSSMDYPRITPDKTTLASLVQEVEDELNQKYRDKRHQVMKKLATLQSLVIEVLDNPDTSELPDNSAKELGQFIANIEFNFGSGSVGFQHISNETIKTNHLENIVTAISNYHTDLESWNKAVSSLR